MGQLCDACAQLDGTLVDIGKEALVHAVHHHVGAGADHRVAPKGRTMGAGAHALGHLFVHQHCADGQAAQTLSQRDHVRLEVVVLAAQKAAGAAYAGLDFVHDQHQVFSSQSLRTACT